MLKSFFFSPCGLFSFILHRYIFIVRACFSFLKNLSDPMKNMCPGLRYALCEKSRILVLTYSFPLILVRNMLSILNLNPLFTRLLSVADADLFKMYGFLNYCFNGETCLRPNLVQFNLKVLAL